MNFKFQYQEAVWLSGLIILFIFLYYLSLRKKKKIIKTIGDSHLVNDLTKNHSSKNNALKLLMLCLAFLMGVFALMNLRKPGSSETERRGFDMVIAMDISKSMYANDLLPNRLEQAKALSFLLMETMPDNRFALVLFAGKAYLQMPLTTDIEATKLFISTARPEALPQQGTVISDAMRVGSLAFNKYDRKFKLIILISDGEDHDLNAEQTAKDIAEQGILIYTIGIGSTEGSNIIDPATGEMKKDLSGKIIVTKLNEEVLKNIAAITKGEYIHMNDAMATAKNLASQFNQVQRKDIVDVSMMNFDSYFRWFALPMFLLLIVEIFISERKKAIL